jgi:CDP-glucose 4,6-dehydratase
MFSNCFQGKRVLVTGHTGFKGAWLSQWLLDLGARVTGYSIGIPTQPSLFEALDLRSRLDHRKGDIRDASAVQQLFQEVEPDIVFHLAAQALVRPSYDLPRETFETNLMGTVNVLEGVRKSTRLITGVIVTTDKCYENQDQGVAFSETAPLGGKDPYAASKACAEIAFSAYSRSFFGQRSAAAHFASARAGNVIGGGDWSEDRIVPDCVRSWSAGEVVSLRHPQATRPWQHVLEPLGAYLFLAASLSQSPSGFTGQAFNFGPAPDGSRTVQDLVEALKRTWTQARWQLADQPDPLRKEAAFLSLNCQKAEAQLGWRPVLHFDESVQMTARWYRDYYENPLSALSLTTDQIRDYASLARARGHRWTL